MSGGDADTGSHTNAIGWMILLCVFAALIYGIWAMFDTEIRNMVRYIRYGEMWLVKIFFMGLEAIGLYDGTYSIELNGRSYNWDKGFDDTMRFRPEDLTYGHMAYFGHLAMQPLQYFFVTVLMIMGLWSYRYGPKAHFRDKLSLEGLLTRQSAVFPVIAPFVKFNPSKQPPRPPGSPVPAELPLFAEALGPEEWIAYYDIPVPDGQVDENAAEAAFLKQLGGRWQGAMRLEPYKQIMLASFCLKAARKRKEADAMLGRLSLCWDHQKGLVFSRDRKLLREARAVLRNKKLSGDTLAKANNHAFETTALLRALLTAREEGGVLPSASFVWLRAYNRELWYPLNNLGRQSFHIEALGAMSHYKMEKITDRPIPVPKLEEAVGTIVDYMKSDNARPIPQLDYSDSKKRGVKKAV